MRIRFVLLFAPAFQLVRIVLGKNGRHGSTQDIYDFGSLEFSMGLINTSNDIQQLFACINLVTWMSAIVTHFIAIILMEVFPEIVQKYAASANGSLGITSCFFQKLTAYFLFAYGLFAEEFCKTFDVLNVKIGNTTSFAPVSTSAPRFLIVAFETLRHIIMQDESNIRFIDSHPKGYCRDNDIAILIEECILVFNTFCSFQSRMVG